MTNYLKIDRHSDGVLVATLSRPESRNALADGDELELIELARMINADTTVKALVCTGEGSVFCAGADLPRLQSMSRRAATDLVEWYPANIQQLPVALLGIDVPTLAAINGPALGIGFDIACMFDLRIASQTAVFAESFITMGIVPGDGGAWLSQRATTYALACELAFTGDPIDAERALSCGLVSKVVPPDCTLDETLALASRMARRSGPALRMSKRLMRAARTDTLTAVLQMSAAYQAIAHGTPEHHQLVDDAVARLEAQRRKRAAASTSGAPA